MYSPTMFCHSIFSDSDVKTEPFSFSPSNKSDDSHNVQEEVVHISKDDISDENHVDKKSKQQVCKVCGKILSSASSYYVHLKQHSDSKPYRCSMCDASFCRKPYLEVHMRVHTGEKPFECDICQKRFTQKSSLNTHKRSHSGLRPYACEICLKRFSVRSYLVAHQWSHAAAGGILCNLCQITFTNKSQFMQHIRSHTERGFECEDCKKSFAKESYLIRHKNRMHRNIRNGGDGGLNSQEKRKPATCRIQHLSWMGTKRQTAVSKLLVLISAVRHPGQMPNQIRGASMSVTYVENRERNHQTAKRLSISSRIATLVPNCYRKKLLLGLKLRQVLNFT